MRGLDVRGALPVGPRVGRGLDGDALLAPVGGGVVDQGEGRRRAVHRLAAPELRELLVLGGEEGVRQVLQDERPSQKRGRHHALHRRLERVVAFPDDDELAVALAGQTLPGGERAHAVPETVHGVDHQERRGMRLNRGFERLGGHDVPQLLGLVPREVRGLLVHVGLERNRRVHGIVQPGMVPEVVVGVEPASPLHHLVPLV